MSVIFTFIGVWCVTWIIESRASLLSRYSLAISAQRLILQSFKEAAKP